jgi:hypothetical protein
MARGGVTSLYESPAKYASDRIRWNDSVQLQLSLCYALDQALCALTESSAGVKNEIFEAFLRYQDCSDDDDRFWDALHTLESCVRLAPWLVNLDFLPLLSGDGAASLASSRPTISIVDAVAKFITVLRHLD